MSKKTHIAFILCLISVLPAFGKSDAEMDRVFLKNGSSLEGSLVSETETHVKIETLGGLVILPRDTLSSVLPSSPGQSEMRMGVILLDRKRYERAERFLKQAQSYNTFQNQANAALERMQKEIEAEKKKQQEEEREKIDSYIERRGLRAGIEELKRRHREADEYWGRYRGHLHLLMAKDRLDHLDFYGAERQLLLAEQYGIPKEDWQDVRDKIVSMKRDSILHGRKYLEEKLAREREKKKTERPVYSNFLAAVEAAEQNGEKLPPKKWLELVDKYSRENRLNPLLVWAMIDVESSWRHKVVSPKGAQGLMQLMPLTAGDLNVKKPFDPEDNIRGGTKYLNFLLEMFNDDLDTALAAYNVGPGRVERKGIPAAGKRYIKKVRDRYAALKKRFNITENKQITRAS